MNMSMDFIFVGIIISLLSIALIYRVVKGPHVIDRVAAADSIDIIIGLVMVLYGCFEEKSFYLDLGLIVSLMGFIGTILTAKYMEGDL